MELIQEIETRLERLKELFAERIYPDGTVVEWDGDARLGILRYTPQEMYPYHVIIRISADGFVGHNAYWVSDPSQLRRAHIQHGSPVRILANPRGVAVGTIGMFDTKNDEIGVNIGGCKHWLHPSEIEAVDV